MGLINKKEVTILPQTYFTSAEKEIARNNIGAIDDVPNSGTYVRTSGSWVELSGSNYNAGPNINITDNTISGKDWSNEINNKLDTSAFTLPSANWDDTYNTVSSNSASWNEGGGSPELSCEHFVEWNFNRQSTDDMLANPLMALCDTSGTPSGTLNAGDKYMIYVDGLLGQSGNSNNTFVNFGIQSGTVSGQYLLTEPLPSKKLCRSTSTGNDFACSYMFTVPTNGTYSVAVAPDDNNNEYKFFGNTTIRQIKIG